MYNTICRRARSCDDWIAKRFDLPVSLKYLSFFRTLRLSQRSFCLSRFFAICGNFFLAVLFPVENYILPPLASIYIDTDVMTFKLLQQSRKSRELISIHTDMLQVYDSKRYFRCKPVAAVLNTV